ncbi:MAG: hypothetical protein OXR66_00730 [Candidatus Woesearchaeota archaeon]|nr:hypothetical protein [Candidatus Woesearchaeota archaeon]
MQTITEGTTTFVTNSEKKITKGMPIFYNPVMKKNRDLTLFVLATMKDPSICLPMEASGVRAARILNELVNEHIIVPKKLAINDISPTAIDFAKRNVEKNRGNYPKKSIVFSVNEANKFLLSQKHYDYIDIDPFGTPNPFLNTAVQRIQRNGILAVTATDTAALAGTYPRATKRKYWSTPSRTWVMHEIGLRILIRKVQLIAAQYDVGLIPVLSVSADHYYRIFFRHKPSNVTVKNILNQHNHVAINTKTFAINESTNAADPGPLWTGNLHDRVFVKKLLATPLELEETRKLLETIHQETAIEQLGFYDMHELASAWKTEPPRKTHFFAKLGKHVAPTHITPTGFKTDLPLTTIQKHF